MNSKIIALLIATFVIGGGVVVYQKTGGLTGIKDRIVRKVDQKVNDAVSDAKGLSDNEKEDDSAKGDDQTPSKNEVEKMINFENVENPQDLAEEAKKVGPYTCYLTITDKKTGENHKMTVSSDGKMSYMYSADSNTKAWGKVWATEDAIYIESSDENGETHGIKISGKMASAYQQAIGGSWYGYMKMINSNQSDTPEASYDVKCYRNKVDIPHLDVSKFKDLSVNLQQVPREITGSGGMQMNIPGYNK